MKYKRKLVPFYEEHRLMHGDVFWKIAIKFVKLIYLQDTCNIFDEKTVNKVIT